MNKNFQISGNDVDVQKLVDEVGGVDVVVGGPSSVTPEMIDPLVEDCKQELRPYIEIITQLLKRHRDEESADLFTEEGIPRSMSWLNQTVENERLDKELLASIEKSLLNRLTVMFGVVV